jgi:hypothetical protein
MGIISNNFPSIGKQSTMDDCRKKLKKTMASIDKCKFLYKFAGEI